MASPPRRSSSLHFCCVVPMGRQCSRAGKVAALEQGSTDPYAVLGVSRDADQEELRAAHRRRSLLLHPDRHAGASEEVQREATRAMADLNAAYDLLADSARRAEFDARSAKPGAQRSSGSASRPSSEPKRTAARPPLPGECLLCGSTPVASLRLIQQVGRLITGERRELNEELCRICGMNMSSEVLNATLLTGWWGLISFFANIHAIVVTYRSLRVARDLPPPRATPGVRGPVPPGLRTGPPMSRRLGPYVGLLLVAIVGSVAFDVAAESQVPAPTVSPRPAATSPTTPSSGGAGTNAPSSSPRDLEGECLVYTWDERIEDVVPCSRPHDARVVEVVLSSRDCPASAPYYFEVRDRGLLYHICVDA